MASASASSSSSAPSAATTTLSTPSSIASKQKRRACDECRSRKLACSKGADGCDRCSRENISCHYSEQKAMGRPRKRQTVERPVEKPSDSSSTQTTQEYDPAMFVNGHVFWNEFNTSVPEPYFASAMGPLPSNALFPLDPAILQATTNSSLHRGETDANENSTSAYTAGINPWLSSFEERGIFNDHPIDFSSIAVDDSSARPISSLTSSHAPTSSSLASVDAPAHSSFRNSETPSKSHVASVEATHNMSLTPSDNPARRSVSDSEPMSASEPAESCNCLTSMYLSLAAMENLPTTTEAALRTVRDATAAAFTSLWCPACGSIMIKKPNPPISSFKNTMLMGTIIPVIADGYKTLLRMIDEETEAATAAGEMKWFVFNKYGDMCGMRDMYESAAAGMTCVETKHLLDQPVEMPPAQWRSTIRALLRVDMYGHEQEGIKYKGLHDILTELEYRQKLRHDMMDLEIAAGTLDLETAAHGFFRGMQPRCLGERTYGCMEIIRMARISVDSIVIA